MTIYNKIECADSNESSNLEMLNSIFNTKDIQSNPSNLVISSSSYIKEDIIEDTNLINSDQRVYHKKITGRNSSALVVPRTSDLIEKNPSKVKS